MPTSPTNPTTPPFRILLRGGHVHGARPSAPATALGIEDGRVVFVGDEDRALAWTGHGEGAPEIVELDGRLVTPAFVDAHVHTVPTGFLHTELDLVGSPSLADTLERLHDHVAHGESPEGTVVLGTGWDDTLWPEGRPPTADEIERACPGRRVHLSRVDAHSAVVSHALADAVPGLVHLDGWEDSGRVTREAAHAVTTALGSLIGPVQRAAAARQAMRLFAAAGIAAVHENAAPHIGPEYELDLVARAAAEAGLHATLYWGELEAIDAVARLGVVGLAGDLNVDGAVGSRTAAMREAYADAPGTTGAAYLDEAQVAAHVVACTQAGVQAGFHCIGDAALDVITEGFARAAEKVGHDALRRSRHRLEHVEMPSRRAIEVLSACGVYASVQPLFDALWGGPEGMYAERLGERWRAMNPFAELGWADGITLAFGSDTPVTAVDPWATVRAAVHPWLESQALLVPEAFRAHTRNGWRAAGDDEQGSFVRDAPATYAVWDTPAGLDPSQPPGLPLPVLDPGAPLPTCVRTVVDGRTVHDRLGEPAP
ncbi:amidohydrolase family protein [Nocardioides sp. HDW12B]|nr:amidohydrolase family protein [Nocardioides sp. HDW12B]